MKRIPLVRVVDRLENATLLDPLAKQARRIVGAALRPRWLRDILHGVPLGHPVHPLAVQVPLGTWVSAAVLDAVPGTHRASQERIARRRRSSVSVWWARCRARLPVTRTGPGCTSSNSEWDWCTRPPT